MRFAVIFAQKAKIKCKRNYTDSNVFGALPGVSAVLNLNEHLQRRTLGPGTSSAGKRPRL